MPKEPIERDWIVKVTYTGRGHAYVSARTAEEAIEKVKRGEMDDDQMIEVEIDSIGSAEVNE